MYLAASIPYFAAGHGLPDWLRLQQHMATFGWGVKGDRPFASRPVTWPFDAYPIWYKWSVGPHGTAGLLAIGNFLLWWTGVATWVVLGLLAILRRDWRLGLAPALVAVLYLPWLLTSRQTYIYYMVPVVPFMAIMVAAGLVAACRRPVGAATRRSAGRGAVRGRRAPRAPARRLGVLRRLRRRGGPVRAVRPRHAGAVRLLRLPDAVHDLEVGEAGSPPARSVATAATARTAATTSVRLRTMRIASGPSCSATRFQ